MSTGEHPLPRAADILELQNEAVVRWHQRAFDNPYQGLQRLVCRQHEANFRLWHQEDIARSPTATDSQIAEVKRTIDRLNQGRNDLIESIDDEIAKQLITVKICDEASLNTETPGSVIDRLSILSLRLFHYQEQAVRIGVDEVFRRSILDRVLICRRQQTDLSDSLQELIDDLFSGRKRHQTYRQLKMYNDPSLNPAIYNLDS